MNPAKITLSAVIAALIALATPILQAQDYPSRPVRLIVTFPPGGTGDALGRIFAQALQNRMGQPVIVDNRPGAGAQIGVNAGAKAAADGYTLLFTPVDGMTILPALKTNVPYDPIKDFTHITLVARNPLVYAVVPSLPVNNVNELIAYAKANPGAIRFGSAGIGSVLHLCIELMRAKAGIDLVHIPYKGGGPVIQGLLGGQIEMGAGGLTDLVKRAAAGQLRLIAQTGALRHPLAPDVPTLAEAGMGEVAVLGWFGLSGPAGLPQNVVTRLHRDAVAVLAEPEVIQRLVAIGTEPAPMSPSEFSKFVADETRRWAQTFKAAGIAPQD